MILLPGSLGGRFHWGGRTLARQCRGNRLHGVGIIVIIKSSNVMIEGSERSWKVMGGDPCLTRQPSGSTPALPFDPRQWAGHHGRLHSMINPRIINRTSDPPAAGNHLWPHLPSSIAINIWWICYNNHYGLHHASIGLNESCGHFTQESSDIFHYIAYMNNS